MADNEENIVLQGTKLELMELIPQLMTMYQLIKGRDIGHVYGVPVTTFQDTYEFAPQVKLMFYQTAAEARASSIEDSDEKPPVTGEITFKVTNETHETMTEVKAIKLAQSIKTKFVTGNLFTWQKGKQIVTYLDKLKGYDFRLYVISEIEARKIIEQTLDIQNHTPDWEKLTVHTSQKQFPDRPSKKLIYGVLRRPPRRRPVEVARFRYAELHIYGVPNAITLIDTTGRRSTGLIKA